MTLSKTGSGTFGTKRRTKLFYGERCIMERKLENNTDNPVTFLVAIVTIAALTLAVNLFSPAEPVRVASEAPVSLDTSAPVNAPAAAKEVEPEK